LSFTELSHVFSIYVRYSFLRLQIVSLSFFIDISVDDTRLTTPATVQPQSADRLSQMPPFHSGTEIA
jgi:hypothetical protein